MPMERLEPANMGRIPAGIITHRSNAHATPQINPAPGLVARWEKNRLKASPKRLPSNTPCASEVVSSALRRAPPAAPRLSPSRGSIQTQRGGGGGGGGKKEEKKKNKKKSQKKLGGEEGGGSECAQEAPPRRTQTQSQQRLNPNPVGNAGSGLGSNRRL